MACSHSEILLNYLCPCRRRRISLAFIASALFSLAIAMAILNGCGFVATGLGAAIIGETRRSERSEAVTVGIDAMKDEYRRPALIPFPKDNPYTLEKAELGKKLYFDSRLSVSSAQSCASCHSPAFGWGDGLPVGVGHGMVKLERRSPTIVNSAWASIFMWDGRAASLEEQALGPIQAANEMNMSIDRLLDRLTDIAEYKSLFVEAFPSEGLNSHSLAGAIATYERTVVSERAPFDYWIEGSEQAISEEAKRGFVLFNTKGQCSSCHDGWNFTDEGFHDIGLSSTDIGRGRFLPGIPKMEHAFKTPGLREISRRAPYMHDGTIATLEEVVEHYNRGGIARASRSDLIAPLDLTAQEKADLIAFLRTLTAESNLTVIPTLPR